ncbi:uncharacterized protein DMAD_00473 [Drosophila madeirensis]|uniref:Uncharacterized protein n=1 Tax=Drosophila madeirensis TaxID=30013 RepID=A0AAU9FY04_DROMD
MMNALATFAPRYTLRNNKRKSKENADHEKYLGQAYGHTRLSNSFIGLFSVGRAYGVPSLYQNQFDV